jgi:hypothetical protein
MPEVMTYREIAAKAPRLFWFNAMQDLGLKLEESGRTIGDYAMTSPASNRLIINELKRIRRLIGKRLELLEAGEEE